MKIFLFNHVDQLTNNHHSSGALNIIANDLEHALNLAKSYISADYEEDDEEDYIKKHPIKLTELEIERVVSYDLVGEDIMPQVLIYPNAGCC